MNLNMKMLGLMAGLKISMPTGRPAPSPMPASFLVKRAAHEPIVGQELHVMYHFIIPTEPFANVRMIASQTGRYAPGAGLTLIERQNALAREARGLRDRMLTEAEILRRDLTARAFTIPTVTSEARSRPKTTTGSR